MASDCGGVAALRAEVAALRAELSALRAELSAARATETEHRALQDARVGELQAGLDTQHAELARRLEEHEAIQRGRVDLVQRQAFARYHEGIGALRSELAELGLTIAELVPRSEVSHLEQVVAELRAELVDVLTEARRS